MGMNEKISVGIPCYNEEGSIAYTLASVFSQKNISDLEIIVCVNGCTDHTEEIVSRISQRNPNLRLIRSPRGKPHAWNSIRKIASGRYILFMDGDVILSEKLVCRLYRKLKANPFAVAAGSNPIALYERINLFTPILYRYIEKAELKSLAGAGYMIDNFSLTAKMRALGYKEMPEDLISEDTWLASLIGQDNIVYDLQAKIFHLSVSSLSDFIGRVVRGTTAGCQLRREYPCIRPMQNLTLCDRLLAKIDTWKRLGKKRDRAFFPLIVVSRHFLARLCDLRGRYLYRNKRHTNQWRPLVTTKNGLLLNSLYHASRHEDSL